MFSNILTLFWIPEWSNLGYCCVCLSHCECLLWLTEIWMLIIIPSHNSQRLFTYAPLIASSTPFVLVDWVQLGREVGWVVSGSLWGHSLLIMTTEIWKNGLTRYLAAQEPTPGYQVEGWSVEWPVIFNSWLIIVQNWHCFSAGIWHSNRFSVGDNGVILPTMGGFHWMGGGVVTWR